MVKRLLIVYLISGLVCIGCAQTQKFRNTAEEPYIIEQFQDQFTFPDNLAGCKKLGVIDYESQKPGLGYGVKYQDYYSVVDIYVYDLKYKVIPPGVESDQIRQAYDSAINEIKYFAGTGTYENL